jgi:hypothetical protein
VTELKNMDQNSNYNKKGSDNILGFYPNEDIQ